MFVELSSGLNWRNFRFDRRYPSLMGFSESSVGSFFMFGSIGGSFLRTIGVDGRDTMVVTLVGLSSRMMGTPEQMEKASSYINRDTRRSFLPGLRCR